MSMPDPIDRAVHAAERIPVTTLDDPRALQILSAEHSSLQSARSLAYNEAFTRSGMFLGFLSTTFVALALLAQALPNAVDFLPATAIVLALDLIVGATTYGRIVLANHEDYLAVHGMARIRHGYGEIAPLLLPYLPSGTHDDLAGVMISYGSPPARGLSALAHQLTTSASMIGLIVAMVGGVLALTIALIAGAPSPVALGVAVVAALAALAALFAATVRFYMGVQARLEVMFPTPEDGPN
jgi:hypothetical protein